MTDLSVSKLDYNGWIKQPIINDDQEIHHLKTWVEFFNAVACGEKTWEVRKNDRNYSTGDIVVLQEYSREWGHYTGRYMSFQIGAVYHVPQTDFVSFALEP